MCRQTRERGWKNGKLWAAGTCACIIYARAKWPINPTGVREFTSFFGSLANSVLLARPRFVKDKRARGLGKRSALDNPFLWCGLLLFFLSLVLERHFISSVIPKERHPIKQRQKKRKNRQTNDACKRALIKTSRKEHKIDFCTIQKSA